MEESRLISSYENHPTQKGVYIKHFFLGEDTKGLFNNLEVRIEPGCEIKSHIHEDSAEYFYIAKGCGKFLLNGEWEHVRAGDALFSPKGVEHAIKNITNDPLILFSTFSPPIK